MRRVKIALASRYIFDNWCSLLIEYLLAKYILAKFGFNVKLKMVISGRAIEVGLEVFERLTRQILPRHVLGWRYDNSCDCWVRGNVRFKHWHNSILDVFDYGHWDGLNVEDKVVVDVGAFIGDSSIYFAWRGARKVVAVEPHPGAYEEMLENIRLNSLETTIFPINAGLASRPSKILLEEADIETTNVTYHRPKDQKGAIPVVTLGDLIREFNLNGTVLKMNCEGCEYDVILNDYEHVKKFEELLF
jgi:FkbM family methyltransferase